MNLSVDIAGWIGAAALLTAYGMISNGRVSGRSSAYQLANFFGSFLLLANTMYYGAYPSSAVNALWICIAGISLLRTRRAVNKFTEEM